MPNQNFLGADFKVLSLTQVSDHVLRIKFAQVPLAVDPSGSTDATNPSNYSISGPHTVEIVGARTVSGDLESIDLFMDRPLETGTWTVTVDDAVEARDNATTIQAPKSASVSFSTYAPTETVHQGATNHDSESTLRKFLNPAFKGRGWNAMLAGFAAGDAIVRENARLAFNQLFSSTASGTFLDQRAADDGIGRPENLGMTDEQFRNYKIKVTNRKLTHDALLQVLEIFYGADALRANITSAKAEPFDLNDQDDLNILFDEKSSFRVVFSNSDFANPAEATALEVSSIINRALRAQGFAGYAVTVTDPVTGSVYVKIYSGSLGLGSTIRCTGGKAQSSLWFPSRLDVYTGTPLWDISYSAVTGLTTFETTTSSAIKMWMLQVGDYVNIFGDDFEPENRGSYRIDEVYETYIPSYTGVFKVTNTAAVTQSGTGVYAEAGMTFFRPEKDTIQASNGRTVVMAQQGDRVDVQMPCTTIAVVRELLEAAYLQSDFSTSITDVLRLEDGTIDFTVDSTSGLAPGNQVLIEDVYGDAATPTETAADTMLFKTATCLASIWSELADTNGSGTRYHQVVRLGDNRAVIMGGEDYDGMSASDRTTVETFELTSSFTSPDDSVGWDYVWTLDTDLPASRKHFTASYLPKSGRVFVYGGLNSGGGPYTEAWYFIPGVGGAGVWLDGTSGDDRAGHAATVLDGGDIVITGGIAGAGTGLLSARRYTPATDTWTNLTSMFMARAQHSQVLLSDGKILVSGGRSMPGGQDLDYIGAGTLEPILHTCEVYDAGGDTWTKTGHMASARFGHALILLPDGRVLAIGGVGYNPTQSTTPVALKTTEIWDPGMGTWTPGPEMAYAREFPAAFYLESKNAIYVAGGTDVTQGEFLDLTTMRWEPSRASLAAARPYSMGVALDGDYVLLTGGMAGSIASLENFLLLPAAEETMVGGLNGVFVIDSLPSGKVRVVTGDRQKYTNGVSLDAKLTLVTAATGEFEGPYLLNPKSGPAVTGSDAVLDMAVTKGEQYSVLHLTTNGALDFPDEEGYLVIGLGTDYQTFPVKYFGRLSASTLAIDPSFVFPVSIPSGTKVTLLFTKGAWIPDSPETIGAFYLTASSSGRVAAMRTLEDIFAAGGNLNIDIVYPSDRGLGGEGQPVKDALKLSDIVMAYSSDEVDEEIAELRGE